MGFCGKYEVWKAGEGFKGYYTTRKNTGVDQTWVYSQERFRALHIIAILTLTVFTLNT